MNKFSESFVSKFKQNKVAIAATAAGAVVLLGLYFALKKTNTQSKSEAAVLDRNIEE